MDEIAKLLEQAESPKDRALLIVLFRIQQNLTDMGNDFTEHRKEFSDHRVEFKAHVNDEQRLLTRGMAAWMTLTLLLSMGSSLGAWYVGHHIVGVNDSQQSQIDANTNRLSTLEAQVKDVRERMNGK